MKKKRSLHLASGIALGAAVAAGATFLYRTKKGKKLRKELAEHLDDAKGFLSSHVENIKKKAKRLEASLEENNQETIKKSLATKKKIAKQLKSTSTTVRKKVFLKSGKPLAK